jgi:hypothetical protein
VIERPTEEEDAAAARDVACKREDEAALGPCAHVVWHSSLLDRSGYAQVARLLVFALDDAGTKIRPTPIWGSMARVD